MRHHGGPDGGFLPPVCLLTCRRHIDLLRVTSAA